MQNEVLNPNSKFANNRKKISILKVLFSPMFFIILFMLFEVFMILYFIDYINDTRIHYFVVSLNIVEIFYLVNSKKVKDSFKITWMIVFVLMPGLGAVLYIILEFSNLFNLNRNKLRRIVIQSNKNYDFTYSQNFKLNINNHEFIKNLDNDLIREEFSNEISFFNYFYNNPKIPLYKNTEVKYFDDGKNVFEDIFANIVNAKKFIFIEMFILSDGIIWQEMLKILKEKASQGIEVRIIVDGLNSISFFNRRYCKYLKEYNIDAKIFKPISPLLSNTQNHRDHRKIIVIDNEIAYTGGINIADEYANLYERFGKWKDSGIKVYGAAVESFTIMFLQLWHVLSKTNLLDFDRFLPKFENKSDLISNDHFYVPYTDYPNLSENISLQIYRYMFNSANRYMYIMTPYLVIDEALVDTIEAAAKRGVDIKIIVPRIADKKYVFYVNRSYYRSLTLAGAKVYEYLPGFIHSKVYLQDDIRSVVGTANLDYRSLYLHYENGVYIFGDNSALDDIKDDFINVLYDSKEMTLEEIIKIPAIQRFFGAVLKMFAPLM